MCDSTQHAQQSARVQEIVSKLHENGPLIKHLMDIARTPGLSLGVLCDGDIVFVHGYVLRSIETSSKATATTAFPIASITKGFTAAACGILVEAGKLDWSKSSSVKTFEFESAN